MLEWKRTSHGWDEVLMQYTISYLDKNSQSFIFFSGRNSLVYEVRICIHLGFFKE